MLASCGGGDSAEINDAAISATTDGVNSQDASLGLSCIADHSERLEATNDGIIDENNQIEPTDLILSGLNDFSICGQIAPAQRGAIFTDVDVYSFRLSGEHNLRLHLQTETNVGIDELEIRLFRAEGPSDIASGRLQGSHALISQTIPAGLYWIAVLAKTAEGTSAIEYTIEATKMPIDCMIQPQMSDYQESLDGPSNRGNDTLSVDYSLSSSFALTPIDSDAPEPTGLEIGNGNPDSIRGTAAVVSSLDDYLDRDAYLITTGSDTDELSLRLSWDHTTDGDFDLHVFPVNQPATDLSFRSGATIGSNNDELITLAVNPNTEYWIWVGLYNNAVQPQIDYQLMLCGSPL